MAKTLDQIVRFLIDDAIEGDEHTQNTSVRGEIVQLSTQWQAMLEHTQYPPAVEKILGEAVAVTLLLAQTIKFDGALTLQVRSSRAISLLVVQANSDNTVRGMANYTEGADEHGVWDLNATDLSLQTLMGGGQMVITIEMGEGKADYQGIVPIEGDRLEEALAAYFEKSEQLPTQLWFAAEQGALAGMLIQKLPNQATAEEGDMWHRIHQLSDTIQGDELLHLDTHTILHRLFHEEQVRVFDAEPVQFKCTCSRQKTESVLRSIGKQEAMNALEEQGEIEIQCQFCSKKHIFDAVDVRALFSATHQEHSATRH